MKILRIFFVISTVLLCSCSNPSPKSAFNDISIKWELLSNTDHEDQSTAVFTFTNESEIDIVDTNWNLYFNQANVMPSVSQKEQLALVSHINGDWFKLTPSSNFSLEAGSSIDISCNFDGAMIKMTDIPMGLYFVTNEGMENEKIVYPINFKVIPFSKDEQINRSNYDYVPIPTSVSRFNENAAIHKIDSQNVSRIIPSPHTIKLNKKELVLTDKLIVSFDSELESEAKYFKEALKSYSSIPVEFEQETANLKLKLAPVEVGGIQKEAYKIEITDRDVQITGNDPAGVFYGIQTFFALLPISNKNSSLKVPTGVIKDAPRFGYRGLQLDVARNFQSKETIFKVIDLLSTYKINTLLLYLTEDEGWRLEIEDLPELTDIGSKRKHTSMESSALHPSYGSGPFADGEQNYGKGYYSKSDFIEILQYAKTRHVMVIPEVNLPGHARAAIKAMEFRYDRFMKEGNLEEAEKYRLIDPDDKSVYTSAQSFKDNVVCVCRESVYTFYEKVIDEIIKLYKEAEAPLEYFHTGGDEVPKGPWTQSPICDAFIASIEDIEFPRELRTYFFRKTVEILEKRNLKIAGWEETALKLEDEKMVVDTEFVGKNVIPFVWNNLWGAQDLGYKMANKGYKVVLCPVTNFYFDLAYDKDPEEPGLYWAGFVDTKNAYEFAPYDVFKTTYRDDASATPINTEEAFANMERLRKDARKNILGIQAQLWGETLKGQDMMEYYLLPKLFGFAESAWAKEKVWERIENKEERTNSIQEGWSNLLNTVGEYELERLDDLFGGYAYRIPMPGSMVKNDTLRANVRYPQLTIRYTLDGSEPTINSKIYLGPIEVNGEVKLKTFNNKGRASRTSIVNTEITKIKP